MAINLSLFFVIIWSHIWAASYSSSMQRSNPLNGQHLRVIWPLWSGNPKGLSGPLKGGVILDYLATRLNFTCNKNGGNLNAHCFPPSRYEMIRVTESRLESIGNKRGLLSYLWNEECDLLIHDILQTYQRQQIIDMTVPWIYSSYALLMPVQDETANIYAVIKPFQWPIWLGLAISTVSVIIVLNLLQRYLAYLSLSNTVSVPIETRNQNLSRRKVGNHGHVRHATNGNQVGNQYLYVIGNLLSQGFPCTSNRLSFRLVAGVWSLATFVFVQAYTSTLFTYVVTPINPPLVKSAFDIVENKDIHLLVRKAGIMDTFISNNNRSVLGIKLKDKLNSFPQSRCTLASECFNLLSPGSKNVFMDASAYLIDAIRENFKRDGKCNWRLARDGVVRDGGMISFALPKRSLNTKAISQGMLELMQTGIIDHWDLWFRPMPHQCMGHIKNGHKSQDGKMLGIKNQPPALSLKNLTGAFVILLFGFSLSFLAFLCEQIIAMPSRNRQRMEKARNDDIINKQRKTTREEPTTFNNANEQVIIC